MASTTIGAKQMKTKISEIEKMTVGPMGAGKTTWLMELSKKYRSPIWKFTTVEIQRATPTKIKNHEGHESNGYLVNSFEQITNSIRKDQNVLLLDEIQFSNNTGWINLFEGKKVYIAGLDRDWQKKEFKRTKFFLQLLPSERKNFVNGKCGFCNKKKSEYTAKLKGGENTSIQEGGFDIYQPICLSCYSTSNEIMK